MPFSSQTQSLLAMPSYTVPLLGIHIHMLHTVTVAHMPSSSCSSTRFPCGSNMLSSCSIHCKIHHFMRYNTSSLPCDTATVSYLELDYATCLLPACLRTIYSYEKTLMPFGEYNSTIWLWWVYLEFCDKIIDFRSNIQPKPYYIHIAYYSLLLLAGWLAYLPWHGKYVKCKKKVPNLYGCICLYLCKMLC